MFVSLKNFAIQYLIANTPLVAPEERRKTSIGALIGMLVAAAILVHQGEESGWLVAACGASAVILFALPHSPMAQPWSVIGSYLGAVLIALAVSALVPWTIAAVALALACTVWFMSRLNCLHPPGGAIVLFVVLPGFSGWPEAGDLVLQVMCNALTLLLAAVLINKFLLRRPYPQCKSAGEGNAHDTRDPLPTARGRLKHVDLLYALEKIGTYVDVQEQDLVALFNLAVSNSLARHMGLTCGEIMSKDIVSAEYGTPLEEAWMTLRRHKIKALPVVDPFRRIVGIVTVADFLRQLDETTAAGMAIQLQGLLRRLAGGEDARAEVVGQIMSTQVLTATVDTPVVELVRQLSDRGLHHIPVVDEYRKLIGMVTQSDLIAALYTHLSLTQVA